MVSVFILTCRGRLLVLRDLEWCYVKRQGRVCLREFLVVLVLKITSSIVRLLQLLHYLLSCHRGTHQWQWYWCFGLYRSKVNLCHWIWMSLFLMSSPRKCLTKRFENAVSLNPRKTAESTTVEQNQKIQYHLESVTGHDAKEFHPACMLFRDPC